MQRRDLIKKVSQQTGWKQEVVKEIFDSTIYNIKKAISTGYVVKIQEFATFSKEIQKERKRIIPHTKEFITVPKHFKVKVIVSPAFKKEIRKQDCY